MALSDYIRRCLHRYRTESPLKATQQNLRAMARGGFRRLERGELIGKPIWERDWQVLVILDACRVDLWNEVAPTYDLPQTDGVWSNASCSVDWIQRNLGDYPAQCVCTGYVTANPFTNHSVPDTIDIGLRQDDFAYFAPLYKTEWGEVTDNVYTVPPRPLTNHAIQSWRDRKGHDMDRLIVHYMQPHQPFKTQFEYPESDWTGVGNNLRDLSTDAELVNGACAWQEARKGNIRKQDLWNAYSDNLEWVLEDVKLLLENIDAKVAISADHGNAMGEFGEWAHPPGALAPEVWKVPWVTVDAEDSGECKPEVMPIESAEVDESQLEALGYK